MPNAYPDGDCRCPDRNWRSRCSHTWIWWTMLNQLSRKDDTGRYYNKIWLNLAMPMWERIRFGGYPAMSIGLLVFASVSGGTAWIVDSLFDCNLDAWPKGWGEVPELSVENSRFQEHFDGDVGTIAAPQDPSTAQDNVMSLKLLGAKTISGVAPGVLEESQGLDMSWPKPVARKISWPISWPQSQCFGLPTRGLRYPKIWPVIWVSRSEAGTQGIFSFFFYTGPFRCLTNT